MTHSFVTIAIPFHVRCSDAVEQQLDDLGQPEGGRMEHVRRRLDATELVHFMSITVVRGDKGIGGLPDAVDDHPAGPSYIIMEFSVDGGADPALAAIATAMTADLDALLAAAGVDTEDAALAEFLARHRLEIGQGWFSTPGLNYDGTPDMTVRRIRREDDLAQRIATMVDRPVTGTTALGTLEAVRKQLWAENEKWAFVADPAPCLQANPFSKWRARFGTARSAVRNFLWPFVLAALLPTAVFLLSLLNAGLRASWFANLQKTMWITAAVIAIEAAIVLAAYLLLRRREKWDASEDIAPASAHVERLMKRESYGAQNHLAAASYMKPGRLRHLTLRIGLWAAGMTALYGSRPSFLGKTGVIHFARWLLLPGTTKLLFMSNYDGAWETYLEDFIEEAHDGVTGIWSNTVGFPKTEKLFQKGATDGDRLKRWTPRQQQPSLFWYSAYPTLTTGRIRTNAAIRQGIAAIATEADAADWLSLFGSSPRPDSAMQTAEIPTLAFGGLSRLRHGTCLFLRLSEDSEQNREWLADIAEDVSYGDHLTASSALVLGFSHSGLRKLGLSKEHMATFPVAFQHGNAAPWRARTLGDVGESAPEKWLWGAPHGAQKETDAVMVVYAKDRTELAGLVEERIAEVEQVGSVVYRIDLETLPEEGKPSEPFGFADGISQPIIRGLKGPASREAAHAINPGEIVLGYPDNLGYVPPSPAVANSDDPDGILPSVGADLLRLRPDFSAPQPTAQRDLGMNGTFLVVRQLEQHKDSYDRFLDTAEQALAQDPRVPSDPSRSLRDWIAAKMVGRWKDGTSLIRYPHAPGTEPRDTGKVKKETKKDTKRKVATRDEIKPDNDFLLGSEDPNGLRCPFGAHIRRANPRDSFAPGSQEQLKIVNRHRILRVGRPYKAQNGLDYPGLVFMCLNADIERQFEFIQQSWVLGPSFHGLEDEVDPVVGHRNGTAVFSIPTADGTVRIRGFEDFVRVRGGGYFFLPGKRALVFLSRPPKAQASGRPAQLALVGG